MRYFYLTLLVASLNAVHGYLYSNLTSVSSTYRSVGTEDTVKTILQGLLKKFQDNKQEDVKHKISAQNKTNVLKNVTLKKNLDTGRDMLSSKLTETGSNDKNIGRHYFHIDPVFNSLKNRRFRRSVALSSSSMESQGWIEEFKDKRLLMKFDAVNSSHHRGDVVNMKAVRPFGIKCGDINQHDLPWGTCMLAAECDAEYRIYRGDSFCGRNEFVCCALDTIAYDMYQGLDLSFEVDNSLSTDTEDIRNRDSEKREKKKRHREKKKAKDMKAQLKKKIRNNIANIITAITKLLHKTYRNATAHRTKKTKELQKFIKKMKREYKKEREKLVDAHHFNMANFDMAMAESLGKIRGMNQAFLSNDTFRDIVVNGTVNKENLLRLQQTHPVLSLFFNHRRMGGGDLEPGTEKIKLETEGEVSEPENIKLETDAEVPEPKNIKLETGGEVPEPENIILKTDGEVSEPVIENPKLLEYDVEYGILYY